MVFSRLFFFLYKAIMFMMLRLSYATKKWMFCIIFCVVHGYVYQRLTKVCFHAFLVYYCLSVYNCILLGFDKRLTHFVFTKRFNSVIRKYYIPIKTKLNVWFYPVYYFIHLISSTIYQVHQQQFFSIYFFSSNIYLFCLTCKLIFNSRNNVGLYLLWWQLT